MGKNYWMVVQTHENYQISRDLGLTVHGLRRRHRRRAERMRPDDKLLYYISDLKKWSATATVKSRYFKDDTELWNQVPRGERFPYRLKLEPDIVLQEDGYLDGLQLGPRLEYVKRWSPEHWYLAFFETLHLIPQRDFRLLEGEMKRVLRAMGDNTSVAAPDDEGPEESWDLAALEQGQESGSQAG